MKQQVQPYAEATGASHFDLMERLNPTDNLANEDLRRDMLNMLDARESSG